MPIFRKAYQLKQGIQNAITGKHVTEGGAWDVEDSWNIQEAHPVQRMAQMDRHIWGNEGQSDEDQLSEPEQRWMDENALPGESMADAARRLSSRERR